jgi:hypothetical protein
MSRLTIRVSAEVDACPKCGRARKTTDRACARCGLAVARMLGFERPADRTAAPLEQAWQAARADWVTAARHDEVLRLAQCHDAWAWAARRYRDRLRDDPEDSIGMRALHRLERGLTAGIVRVPTPMSARPYRTTVRLLVMLMIALGIGLAYTSFVHRAQTEQAAR